MKPAPITPCFSLNFFISQSMKCPSWSAYQWAFIRHLLCANTGHNNELWPLSREKGANDEKAHRRLADLPAVTRSSASLYRGTLGQICDSYKSQFSSKLLSHLIMEKSQNLNPYSPYFQMSHLALLVPLYWFQQFIGCVL